MIDHSWHTVTIVDVTDPSSPFVKGNVTLPVDIHHTHRPRVLPGPDYVYVTTGTELIAIEKACPTLVDVAESPAPGGARVPRAVPNPFRQATEIRLVRPAQDAGAVRLFDSAGRRVTSLVYEAGSASVSWDGADASGRTVAPGVYYFASRDAKGAETWGRVTRLP